MASGPEASGPVGARSAALGDRISRTRRLQPATAMSVTSRLADTGQTNPSARQDRACAAPAQPRVNAEVPRTLR
ncbi:hypothetical protein FHS07_001097 [Microbacterium proteolyticum]|uniref:Uncharacterized protein n=1 Tax=Microbacterium proteolyticum TaxID=1572644 RepID=A0A7W5CGU6_9MICO|nr:hypothetical protein [Microbacterium proteolyticum]